MDVLKRIDEIMRKQHLNDYQLSKLSGLSTSTISNMRKRNTIPSIATLDSRMPSAFLLRDARHAMHDIFFCASLQSCRRLYQMGD